MAYIGVKPTIGNFQICDAISVVNGQAAYTMQVGSVNVIPQSANHMIVSLNGVIQKPGSSFTVSGSTITFASNLVTNDVIDFIQILGDVLDLGTPSDATVTAAKIGANAVTAAKLNNDIISGSTELASEPADTDEFLVSDAGTIKRIDYSLIKGGGITVADQWRLTASVTSSGVITSNLEQIHTNAQGTMGSAMSESSGIFTFPSTGFYLVTVHGSFHGGSENSMYIEIMSTQNNSSYSSIARAQDGQRNSTETTASSTISSIVDVTDTSNVKVRFDAGSLGSGSEVTGDTNVTVTAFTFLRLGDT